MRFIAPKKEETVLHVIAENTNHYRDNPEFVGARWRSGRASDSESRGPGFEPHKRHRVVSLSKAHLLPTVLVKPRKRWLRPDMTEKLLTGTLSLNTNKSLWIVNAKTYTCR